MQLKAVQRILTRTSLNYATLFPISQSFELSYTPSFSLSRRFWLFSALRFWLYSNFPYFQLLSVKLEWTHSATKICLVWATYGNGKAFPNWKFYTLLDFFSYVKIIHTSQNQNEYLRLTEHNFYSKNLPWEARTLFITTSGVEWSQKPINGCDYLITSMLLLLETQREKALVHVQTIHDMLFKGTRNPLQTAATVC